MSEERDHELFDHTFLKNHRLGEVFRVLHEVKSEAKEIANVVLRSAAEVSELLEE